MLDKDGQQRLIQTNKPVKTAKMTRPQLEIGIVCDAGTSATGLHGLTELFTYAGQMAARRSGQVALPSVRITHWQREPGESRVLCTYDSCSLDDHDLAVLVLPGNLQATLNTSKDEVLTAWLRGMHARGVVIAAVCGGVFILARTGLLAGRQATTHWALHERFSQEFPNVLVETDHMVIDYGDVLTAGGVLAWADLGLRLVERLLGPGVMMDTARYMNVDPPGREQRFYSDFDPKMKHGDSAIVRAQEWLASQRARVISVTELAAHACMEPRTFLRRFTKATGMRPLEYQQRLRISRARELLEFTRTGISEVAATIGYEDVDSFRRQFRRFTGLTPSDYRRRFTPGAYESSSPLVADLTP
ncbi:GlxA family transcriptional regulator [Dyella sp. 20L07]|uniref:GlxA family transcriptional regulator n=1 Tax=Dyella sp. 20L07 TaxID=3384240 RepID=UPI003D2ABEFC